MFSKSFVSILIVTSSFILAFGQTPEAKMEKENAEKALAFNFAGGGSYLGVQTQGINKENFAKFGLANVRGVAIEKVSENSPAAAAGLQAGDVILRFNGEEITSTRKLTRLIGEVDPDHQARVAILRNGREQELTATLARRPMPKFENGNFEFLPPLPMGRMEMPEMKKLLKLKELEGLKNLPNDGIPRVFTFPDGSGKAFSWRVGGGRQIGVGVTPLGKQLAEHFGVDSGVMISEVNENSPAAKAGLKAGDIIVETNGKAVKGDIDLIRSINEKKEGDLTLTIVRDRKRQTVTITPEASKDGGFLFQTDDEDGLPAAAPLMPGQVRMVRPATPMTAPVPMTMFRPNRFI